MTLQVFWIAQVRYRFLKYFNSWNGTLGRNAVADWIILGSQKNPYFDVPPIWKNFRFDFI